MEDFNYLYVLDTANNAIYEIKLGLSCAGLNTEDILNKCNIDFDYCSFMYSTNRITEITCMAIK